MDGTTRAGTTVGVAEVAETKGTVPLCTAVDTAGVAAGVGEGVVVAEAAAFTARIVREGASL